jgi:hypothetical protein
MQSLAQSDAIQGVVSGLQSLVTNISALLKGEFSIPALGIALAAAVPIFVALRVAATGLTAALGPLGLLLVLAGLVTAFVDWASTGRGRGRWFLDVAEGYRRLAQTLAGLVNDYIIPIKL